MTESSSAPQKTSMGQNFTQPGGSNWRAHEGKETVWQMRGLSPSETPDIKLSAAYWSDLAATEVSTGGMDSFHNQFIDLTV